MDTALRDQILGKIKEYLDAGYGRFQVVEFV